MLLSLDDNYHYKMRYSGNLQCHFVRHDELAYHQYREYLKTIKGYKILYLNEIIERNNDIYSIFDEICISLQASQDAAFKVLELYIDVIESFFPRKPVMVQYTGKDFPWFIANVKNILGSRFNSIAVPVTATDRETVIKRLVKAGIPVHLLEFAYPIEALELAKKYGFGIDSCSTKIPLKYGTHGVIFHPRYGPLSGHEINDSANNDFPGITQWNVRCMDSWCAGKIPEPPSFL